jgi:hypothetical protein
MAFGHALEGFTTGFMRGANFSLNAQEKYSQVKERKRQTAASENFKNMMDRLGSNASIDEALASGDPSAVPEGTPPMVSSANIGGPSYDEFMQASIDALPGTASPADMMNARTDANKFLRTYSIQHLQSAHAVMRAAEAEQDPAKKAKLQKEAEAQLATVYKMLPNGRTANLETLPEGQIAAMFHSKDNPEMPAGQMVIDTDTIQSMIDNFSGEEGDKRFGLWSMDMQRERMELKKNEQAFKWYEPLKTIDAYNAATTNYLKSVKMEADATNAINKLQFGAYGTKEEYTYAMKGVDKYGEWLRDQKTKRNAAEFKAQNDPTAGFIGKNAPGTTEGPAEQIDIVNPLLDQMVDSPYFADATMVAKEMVRSDSSITAAAAYERSAILTDADMRGRAEGDRNKYIKSIDDESSPTGKRLIVYKEGPDGKLVAQKSFNAPPSWTKQKAQKQAIAKRVGGMESLSKAGLKLVGVKLPNGHTVQVPVPKGYSTAQLKQDIAAQDEQVKQAKQQPQTAVPVPEEGATPAPVAASGLTQDTNAETGGGAPVARAAAGKPPATPTAAVPTPEGPPPTVQEVVAEEVSSYTPEQKVQVRDSMIYAAAQEVNSGKLTPQRAEQFASYIQELGDAGLNAQQRQSREQFLAQLEAIVQKGATPGQGQLAGQRSLAMPQQGG